jgi:DNA-binding MarR family transcriptional regulator
MTEIYRLFDAMEMLRKHVKKDMPSQHISLLLKVSQHSGASMPELCDLLEMPQGTLSRNVKSLSSYVDRSGRIAQVRGLGLLYTEQDTNNRHARAVYLTEKGRSVVAELACTINPRLREQSVDAMVFA